MMLIYGDTFVVVIHVQYLNISSLFNVFQTDLL